MKNSKLYMAIAKAIAIGTKSQFLLLTATMVLALMTSCQKTDVSTTAKPAELVSFKFSVKSFTIQDDKFKKSIDKDSIFNLFKFTYSTDILVFTSEDGTIYRPSNGGSLEQESFTLPIGKYTINGNSGGDSFGRFMSFDIPEQAITITTDTKTIPITITPTCYLILVADPYGVIDWSGNYPMGLVWLSTLKRSLHIYDWESATTTYTNTTLMYVYNEERWSEDNYLEFYKKDGTRIQIDTQFFQWGHIYKIFINKPITAIVIPGFQVDSIRNY